MSGPGKKEVLQSTDPDERESQKLEEALVTTKRLIAEMHQLIQASKKTQKEHEELIATLRADRAARRKKEK